MVRRCSKKVKIKICLYTSFVLVVLIMYDPYGWDWGTLYMQHYICFSTNFNNIITCVSTDWNFAHFYSISSLLMLICKMFSRAWDIK